MILDYMKNYKCKLVSFRSNESGCQYGDMDIFDRHDILMCQNLSRYGDSRESYEPGSGHE